MPVGDDKTAQKKCKKEREREGKRQGVKERQKENGGGGERTAVSITGAL